MSAWVYTGKTASGAQARGNVQANSKEEAAKRLLDMGVNCDSIIKDGAPPEDNRPDAKDKQEPEKPPEPPPPEIERSISETMAAFRGTSEYAKSVAPRERDEPKAKDRAQKLLYGPVEDIRQEVAPLLEGNGKVIHARLAADSKGKMMLLLVVESGK